MHIIAAQYLTDGDELFLSPYRILFCPPPHPIDPQLRKALILPGFAHTGELRTSGRNPEEYFVTGPIEVAIQPIIEKGYFPNGTWFNGTVR